MSMTKRYLRKIANETGKTQHNVAKIILMTLDGLSDELISGGDIKLRDL